LQDVVKLLNKSGVRYKPMREAFSDKDCYEEGCSSFLNGAAERKEFVYEKKLTHIVCHYLKKILTRLVLI
jgi:hypothetical protein